MSSRPTRPTLGAAVTALLCAGLATGPAVGPAAAQDGTATETTVCSYPRAQGGVSYTRIEGDLVIDNSCNVYEVVVTGDLVVRADSRAVMTRSTVQGDVRLAAGSSLSAVSSDVWGGVRSDTALSLSLNNSTVFRSVRGDVGQVSLVRADVRGALNAAFPDPGSMNAGLRVTESTVGGWVNTHGGFLRLYDATFNRGLTASAPSRLVACGTWVADDVTVRWSHGPVEMGVGLLGAELCSAELGYPVSRDNRVHGSMLIVDNPHSIVITDTLITGDLICTGNRGPRGVRAAGATVEGTRHGQCA